MVARKSLLISLSAFGCLVVSAVQAMPVRPAQSTSSRTVATPSDVSLQSLASNRRGRLAWGAALQLSGVCLNSRDGQSAFKPSQQNLSNHTVAMMARAIRNENQHTVNVARRGTLQVAQIAGRVIVAAAEGRAKTQPAYGRTC